jgi:hypothetical protein
VWTALPSADYSAPSDSACGPWRFVGVSRAYFPRALTSLTKSPVFGVEDSNGMGSVACYWLPLPRSAAPQSASRVGQVALECLGNVRHCFGPYSCPASAISGVPG